MTSRIMRYFLAVLCAAALFATACGSGSSGTVASSDESTTDETASEGDIDGAESEGAESDGAESDSTTSSADSSGSGESPIADLLGIPISNDDEMEEFFEELSRNAERKISECMLGQGFEYSVIDFSAMGGLVTDFDDDSKEFAEEYGFGIASNPFEEAFESFQGFEDPNAEYLETLGEGERAAYDMALQGEPPELDSEEDFANFTPGGCQGEAYQEVFSFGLVFEQFGSELDEIGEQIDADPRIVAAQSGWAECMSAAGYAYSDVDDAQDDISRRYDTIVNDPNAFGDLPEGEGSSSIEVEDPDGSTVFFGPGTLEPAFQQRVDDLAVEERALALASWECDSPLREIADDIQFEYEQKFVDQYGSAIQDALGS